MCLLDGAIAQAEGHNPVERGADRAAWARARRQHGVVTYAQLAELGLTPDAIRHRVNRGRLHRLHRGVFAVGRPEVDQLGRWMAAVLACGPAALLSHCSAGALWEILPRHAGQVEISVPINDKHRPRGVIVHRRRVLGTPDRRARHGIPVTSPVRTLVDLGTRLTERQLEAAVNEADKLDLLDPERLRQALDSMRGQHGMAAIRRLLDRRMFRLTDSELERSFLRLVRRAGLPTPQTGVPLNGFRVDFFWPDLGLVVETDGLRYHRTPGQQARDRRRDQVHAASGLTALRFTHAQVRYEPAEVRSILRQVAGRLAARRQDS